MPFSWTLFSVRGVPIRLHATALFMLPMFQRYTGNLLLTLLCIALLLGSIALHELGHTLVAQRYGIPVLDIMLTPIGGVARCAAMPENPHHETRIAVAGPAVSLLLAIVFRLLVELFLLAGLRPLALLCLVAASMNTMLLLFNLLPSFPMDGGRVLRASLVPSKGFLEATRIAAQLGKYISTAFFLLGLLTANFGLAIIGIFIFLSAGTEYRMALLKTFRDPASSFSGAFQAGPPPYAQSSPPRAGLLADILQAFRDLREEIRSIWRT